MLDRLSFNERASLERPSWTSESSTGQFESWKHKHCRTKDRTGVILNYYGK